MMRTLSRALLCLSAAVVAACDNEGASRTLGIDATGIVTGSIFLDVNGSGLRDAGDLPFVGARVRLLTSVSRDTVLRGTTGAGGVFRFGTVPVGNYEIVVDETSGTDGANVVILDESSIVVLPGDSLEVNGMFSAEHVTAADIRTMPLLENVFLTGVALHARDIYSDTLLHVMDGLGAIRAVRPRPGMGPVVAGDSVRLHGRVSMRLGQRALEEVTVYVLGSTFIPTLSTLTTAVAATANAGAFDAALVRVNGAPIIDTATVNGSLHLTVNDGSGALVVVLDRAADVAFRAPLPAGVYDAGDRYDLIGILVPTGTGSFVLRPRSAFDLTLR